MAEFDKRLADPGIYRDPEDARRVKNERTKTSASLEVALERWTELAERDE